MQISSVHLSIQHPKVIVPRPKFILFQVFIKKTASRKFHF